MNWHDEKVDESSYFTVFSAVICLGVLLFSLCTAVAIFLSTSIIKNKLISLIGGIGIGVYVLNLLSLFFNGPRIINSLSVKNNMIKVANSIKQKSKFTKSELIKIEMNRHKWFLGWTPSLFKTQKPYFSIYFNNGQSYVVSPYMERFDELKDVLTRIVEDNKISASS